MLFLYVYAKDVENLMRNKKKREGNSRKKRRMNIQNELNWIIITLFLLSCRISSIFLSFSTSTDFIKLRCWALLLNHHQLNSIIVVRNTHWNTDKLKTRTRTSLCCVHRMIISLFFFCFSRFYYWFRFEQ